jgi:aspartyl-tRNA(Asn)/glutamyl-tRNA(Gln) amidotransferase subunit A
LDIQFAGISELGRLYRSEGLSPVAVVTTFLDRIHRHNERLRAYITVTADRAMAQAHASEQMLRAGVDLGPLHGIPIALKDLFNTANVCTTSGSRAYEGFVPKTSATVARRLERSGTILLGKTNMVELAFGPYGINPTYGTPPNPWDPERVCGGSSSGSGVAVAAGLTTAAMGTDTGGSIRIPASFCGIVGLKPTLARVSRAGVTPLSWTLDSMGPLARSVEDVTVIFDAVAGADPGDPITSGQPKPNLSGKLKRDVRGIRVGFVRDPFCEHAENEVVSAMEEATRTFKGLGAQVEEMDFPEAREALKDELAGSGSSLIMSVEAMVSHQNLIHSRREVMDARIWDRIHKGAGFSAVEYAQVLLKRESLMRSATQSLQNIDALICPTMLTVAPRIADVAVAPSRLTTRLINFLGMCAVSVPCGFSRKGLPIGLQIVGKPYDELVILQLAYAYERATSWCTQHPNDDQGGP